MSPPVVGQHLRSLGFLLAFAQSLTTGQLVVVGAASYQLRAVAQ